MQERVSFKKIQVYSLLYYNAPNEVFKIIKNQYKFTNQNYREVVSILNKFKLMYETIKFIQGFS